jgi:hypothetical protein
MGRIKEEASTNSAVLIAPSLLSASVGSEIPYEADIVLYNASLLFASARSGIPALPMIFMFSVMSIPFLELPLS